MTELVDVVNFNADASCLPSARWLAALEGGDRSELHRWLEAYVACGRKVSLGFTGATVADIAAYNPEAIHIIDAHPDTFELLLRPFAHDIAILRSHDGFTLNVELGRRAISDRFHNVSPYFLPPEFMLTNAQVRLLQDLHVEGVFINARRFKPAVAERIPVRPYRVSGVLGSGLASVPLDGGLTQAYLAALHDWEGAPWNAALCAGAAGPRFSWRDGESWLFLPDGLAREVTWLRDESPAVRRVFVRDAVSHAPVATMDAVNSYPVHSFAEWVREFRMLGYLQRVREAEHRVASFSVDEQALWLQAINSDVLSAVEKDDPRILLRVAARLEREELVLPRTDRGFEGEDFLAMLEQFGTSDVRDYLAKSERPHLRKLRARMACLAAGMC